MNREHAKHEVVRLAVAWAGARAHGDSVVGWRTSAIVYEGSVK
jgi:hypothetical protein